MSNKLGIGLVAGAMGLSLAFGATGLAVGLTKKGNPGKTAYEIAVEHGFTGTEAEWIAMLQGATGDQGAQGPQGVQGEKGPDGISLYVGYDGYIWSGNERTQYFVEKLDSKYTFENTIKVAGTMSDYFDTEFVDLTENRVALMANYMPTIGKTQYSGSKINKIKVYAEEAGTLMVGTAKVSDVVAARTTGAAYTATTTSYNVVAGENELTVNLEPADDETIVLGGEGSTAKLCVVKGVNGNDEAGNFALLNGEANANLVSKTGEYADTLAIATFINDSIEGRVFDEDVTTEVMPSNKIVSGTAVSLSGGPYTYTTNYFAGKHITKIGIPAKTVSSLTSNPYITIYVVDTTKSSVRDGIVKKIRAEVDKTTLTSTTINNWVYATIFKDSNGNVLNGIELTENQTISFGAYNSEAGYVADTITWAYLNAVSATATKYSFCDGEKVPTDANASKSGSNYHNIVFDVFAKTQKTANKHIADLLAEEEAAKALLD